MDESKSCDRPENNFGIPAARSTIHGSYTTHAAACYLAIFATFPCSIERPCSIYSLDPSSAALHGLRAGLQVDQRSVRGPLSAMHTSISAEQHRIMALECRVASFAIERLCGLDCVWLIFFRYLLSERDSETEEELEQFTIPGARVSLQTIVKERGCKRGQKFEPQELTN